MQVASIIHVAGVWPIVAYILRHQNWHAKIRI